MSADYAKGVLKVRLAKKMEAKPKQIKVNVGVEKTSKPRLPKPKPRQGRVTGSSERNGGSLHRSPGVWKEHL